MNKPRKMHGMMTDEVSYIPRYSSYHQYHKSKKPKISIENLHNAPQQHDHLDIPSNIWSLGFSPRGFRPRKMVYRRSFRCLSVVSDVIQ